jgi:hypothetical protein
MHRSGLALLLLASGGCVLDFGELAEELEDISVDFEMLNERYDVAGARFEAKTPPPTERNLFDVVGTDREVLVLGGVDADGRYLDVVEAYDPSADAWSERAAWPDPGLAWLLPVGDEICAMAGYEDASEPLRTAVHCYVIGEDRWREAARVPAEYSTMYPVVMDGKIWVLGGTVVDGDNVVGPVDTARVYDPATDAWTDLAPLPTARGLMGVVPVQGELYLVGGYSPGNFDAEEDTPEEREMLVYDPAADAWSTAPQMPTSRILFGVDEVGDRLVTFFGVDSATAPLVDVYDPATGEWTSSPNPEEDLDGGVYSYVEHDGLMYFLVLADSLGLGGTAASGKLWVHDVETGEWSVPASRDPDRSDGLFLGAPVGDDLWWVGALTGISLQERPVRRPRPVQLAEVR